MSDRRTRIWTPARVCALIGAVTLVGASAASAAPTIAPGGGPTYPARALILTAPGPTLSSAQIQVLENGRPVSGLAATPLTRARKGDFGVVLAIDTSTSMGGRTMDEAMAAARALAAGRVANQYLGVITFTQTVRTVLPLSTNPRTISRALATRPAVGGGTHLFDAAAAALRQLVKAKVAAGAVIIVTDGGDQGSRLTPGAAAALARTAHYPIYTVGVRDRSFNPANLATLAHLAGGSYSAAAPAALHQTLTSLEAGLASRYVIHYRSLVGLGHRVTVTVTVHGLPGVATLSYATPTPPPRTPPKQTFWTSTLSLVLLSVAGALLIGLAVLMLLAPRVRREGVRTRVRRFTEDAPAAVVMRRRVVTRRGLLGDIERAVRESPQWQRFVTDVEIARIDRTPADIVKLTAIATILVALLVAAASGAPVLVVPVLFVGPLVAWSAVNQRLRHQRKLFEAALPGQLEEIASAMRAGHSIVSAMSVTAEGADEPSRSEWLRVVADEQLGKPLEAALEPVAKRMACRDIAQLALVASLNNRTGGNMAEVLDRLAEAVRERADLRRELSSLTAQARLSRYILTALPPAMLAFTSAINPTYTYPLFHTTTGVALLIAAAVLVVTASMIMRKIVDIQV